MSNYCTYPSCKCIVGTSTSQPDPPCPQKLTRLTPVRDIPSYAVIIRAVHERGDVQREALTELERRRLWLSAEQKQQAGLL